MNCNLHLEWCVKCNWWDSSDRKPLCQKEKKKINNDTKTVETVETNQSVNSPLQGSWSPNNTFRSIRSLCWLCLSKDKSGSMNRAITPLRDAHTLTHSWQLRRRRIASYTPMGRDIRHPANPGVFPPLLLILRLFSFCSALREVLFIYPMQSSHLLNISI